MALPKHFVAAFPGSSAPRERAARRAASGTAGTLALLLSGVLGIPGIAAAQTSPSLSGTWQLSCSGRKGRVRQVTLQIEQSGSKLSGSFSGPRRSGKLSGALQGRQISLLMGADGRSITLTGTTDGNSMTVHGPKGGSCSASRRRSVHRDHRGTRVGSGRNRARDALLALASLPPCIDQPPPSLRRDRGKSIDQRAAEIADEAIPARAPHSERLTRGARIERLRGDLPGERAPRGGDLLGRLRVARSVAIERGAESGRIRRVQNGLGTLEGTRHGREGNLARAASTQKMPGDHAEEEEIQDGREGQCEPGPGGSGTTIGESVHVSHSAVEWAPAAAAPADPDATRPASTRSPARRRRGSRRLPPWPGRSISRVPERRAQRGWGPHPPRLRRRQAGPIRAVTLLRRRTSAASGRSPDQRRSLRALSAAVIASSSSLAPAMIS